VDDPLRKTITATRENPGGENLEGENLERGRGAQMSFGRSATRRERSAGMPISADGSSAGDDGGLREKTERQSRRWHWSGRVVASGAAAATMAVTGVGVAYAATPASPTSHPAPPAPRRHRPGLTGRIIQKEQSGFELETASGTVVRVATDSATRYREGGRSESASALEVGELASVRRRGHSDTARVVRLRLPSFGGVVVGDTGSHLTIRELSGIEVNAVVSSTTTYSRGGLSTTAGAVTDGEHVVVSGVVDPTDNTVSAARVDVVLPRVQGTIESIDGATITLRRPGGTVTVDLSAGTVLRDHGRSIDRSNLSDGERLLVIGTRGTDGVVDATLVRVLPAPPAGRPALPRPKAATPPRPAKSGHSG